MAPFYGYVDAKQVSSNENNVEDRNISIISFDKTMEFQSTRLEAGDILVRFDGTCPKNSEYGGAAAVAYRCVPSSLYGGRDLQLEQIMDEMKLVESFSCKIEVEYEGLICALQLCLEIMDVKNEMALNQQYRPNVVIQSDIKPVIQQMKGHSIVREPRLVKLYRTAQDMIHTLNSSHSPIFELISRDSNSVADKLAHEAIDLMSSQRRNNHADDLIPFFSRSSLSSLYFDSSLDEPLDLFDVSSKCCSTWLKQVLGIAHLISHGPMTLQKARFAHEQLHVLAKELLETRPSTAGEDYYVQQDPINSQMCQNTTVLCCDECENVEADSIGYFEMSQMIQQVDQMPLQLRYLYTLVAIYRGEFLLHEALLHATKGSLDKKISSTTSTSRWQECSFWFNLGYQQINIELIKMKKWSTYDVNHDHCESQLEFLMEIVLKSIVPRVNQIKFKILEMAQHFQQFFGCTLNSTYQSNQCTTNKRRRQCDEKKRSSEISEFLLSRGEIEEQLYEVKELIEHLNSMMFVTC
jgi:ribonuclease HI